MIAAFVAFGATVFAMDVQVPARVRQGHLLRIEAKPFVSGLAATFRDKSVPFFERTGGALALMPVTAVQAPGSYELQIRDSGGNVLERRTFEVIDAGYPTQNIRASKAMKSLKPLPGEMEAMRALHAALTPVAFWKEPFAAPVPHCANSSFGVQRLHNGEPTGNYHRGLDLRSPPGAPVKAAADGKVMVARMFRVHGGTIGLDHGQGVTSHYLHLSRLAVKEGASVRKGQVVGYVGATGFATGPHLHWGVYVHGVPTDPRPLAPGVHACQ